MNNSLITIILIRPAEFLVLFYQELSFYCQCYFFRSKCPKGWTKKMKPIPKKYPQIKPPTDSIPLTPTITTDSLPSKTTLYPSLRSFDLDMPIVDTLTRRPKARPLRERDRECRCRVSLWRKGHEEREEGEEVGRWVHDGVDFGCCCRKLKLGKLPMVMKMSNLPH